MNEETMRQLYEFNNNPDKVPRDTRLMSATKKQKEEDPTVWGGYRTRLMLHCLYVLSMVCLLRYDEALNIHWDDIKMGTNTAGDAFVELHLLVRKTHQNGGAYCRSDVITVTYWTTRHLSIHTLCKQITALDVSYYRCCAVVASGARTRP